MRKPLMLLLSLMTVAVLAPASPASATTCYIEDLEDEINCLIHGTPIAGPLCVKLPVC